MAYLYHGTHAGGIKVLEPRSLLHGTNESVVYLTGNRVYGLFYIWDREHTMGPAYITAGIVKGRVIYEEQFPNQLECFYKGVSGWLYTVNGSHPNQGLKNWTLKDGDVVVWHYINDYSHEVADWFNDPKYPSLGNGT